MKNIITTIFAIVISITAFTLQAQSNTPEKVYKGLFGDYTYSQFKAWTDSVECKESETIRGVKSMQNARRPSDDERIITAKMKIFPVLVHALLSSDTIVDFNGFIRIMEGGAYFYLPVNEQDLIKIKNMNPYTDLICGSPKSSIKGNATQARFLVEVPEDELDEEVVQYLNKNSLEMLKVMCKDIEMCGEPVIVRAR